jgi:6-phosphofructokinase 1
MRFGIEGLLADEVVDLGRQPAAFLERLPGTPAAALGSCRYRLLDEDLEPVLHQLDRYEVRCLIYIGGNDSAETALRIDRAARRAGRELSVIVAPKTIDNDLPVTDHAPGYGSAARFIAQMTAEAGLDTETMQRTDPIKLVEVMGRYAGWLAAAAWLGRIGDCSAPHLVYLPERPRPAEQIVTEVESVYRRLGHCVVVLSENQPGPDGLVLGADGPPVWQDPFGHPYYDSPAQHLARLIRLRLGVRTRVDKPGTLQRMSVAHHSRTDLAEAEQVGRAATALALDGLSGLMVTLVRQSDDPYRCETGATPLERVANNQQLVPDHFIAPSGHALTTAFERYARPLLGDPLPVYARLA